MKEIIDQCKLSKDSRWIPGYEGHYYINPTGEVYSLPTKRRGWLKRLKAGLNSSGYMAVNLCKDGKAKLTPVHTCLLITFKGTRPENCVCRHLDGDRLNNRLENLCWGTAKENGEDMVSHGNSLRGTRHPFSKLTPFAVRVIHRLLERKMPMIDIAKIFNINSGTIHNISTGKAWNHI